MAHIFFKRGKNPTTKEDYGEKICSISLNVGYHAPEREKPCKAERGTATITVDGWGRR